MLTAITRSVSPAIGRCELEYLERRPIDLARAEQQHREYERCLAELGAQVIALPAEPGLPDSVFVEDPALVLDEVAVITRMGAESRRAEAPSLAEALARFRPLRHLTAPATLEGGDVMRAGHTLFVGASARTNRAGIEQLSRELAPFGYSVVPVEVRGCLHLKSACTYLGNDTILAHRPWIDMAPVQHFHIVDVAPEEPWAGNTLTVGGTVLIPSAFPATAAKLEALGYRVRTLDISELMKAEAALTCSSLIFEE
ncbi:Dimethylargininase [Candidatus Sulfopaludibacter sp. SbA3]|nr:Dimethylargininase [Candidatus Sulfopaludibacter sp. SbA3]